MYCNLQIGSCNRHYAINPDALMYSRITAANKLNSNQTCTRMTYLAWLCQFKTLYFLRQEAIFVWSFHSCFKQKVVTDDVWKGSVQTAKSFRLMELLQTINSSSSLSFSLFLVRSHSYQVGAFSFGSVSGYGTVSSTCPATALLLVPQTDPLTLVFTLPKPRSLEDLLHKLLKGTLDAIFGLCTGLCTKERGLPRFTRSAKLVEHFPKC